MILGSSVQTVPMEPSRKYKIGPYLLWRFITFRWGSAPSCKRFPMIGQKGGPGGKRLPLWYFPALFMIIVHVANRRNGQSIKATYPPLNCSATLHLAGGSTPSTTASILLGVWKTSKDNSEAWGERVLKQSEVLRKWIEICDADLECSRKQKGS